ncbi:hypothetical protein QVD17_05017 [Tagetes erecta]|uniref:Uncharacterized protein n=1 Tax=Tagetes erecta TaxID=13708 RepID=A0AAD8PB41_TARER|nr:hypothetical protein QVD17_05017 [Tagetes erecta]
MATNNIISISSRKFEESRAALSDITNDSPIVGLATGTMKTPSSTPFCKKRMITTPGSGEALLRDQVQSLLQKIEEETVIKKIIFEPTSFVNSPMCFLAPTPANTPQLFSDNNIKDSESLTVSPFASASFGFSQMVNQQEETLEKNVITKLLFTEKLEGYDCSIDDEDDASVWSIEVNASTRDEHEYDDDEEFKVVNQDELCEVVIEICE